MSKNWYPVIDYEKCISCLSCVEFCPHEVFVEKDGQPYVTNPDNCVEFCRGCQRGACSSGAINFAGSLVEAITSGRTRIKGGDSR